jgi:hypothetical protein
VPCDPAGLLSALWNCIFDVCMIGIEPVRASAATAISGTSERAS